MRAWRDRVRACVLQQWHRHYADGRADTECCDHAWQHDRVRVRRAVSIGRSRCTCVDRRVGGGGVCVCVCDRIVSFV
jgi:hypothetical protein